MLQLNAEQVLRLQGLKLERDIAQLARVLAEAFPDVPGRLGERYALLVTHGVQRAARHGLLHAVCVARYLACWFMLGAEFENKPGFEWALEILGSTRRDQGAKVFQLCRRVREDLARPPAAGSTAPAGMAPKAFEQAIASLDTLLMPRGTLGSLLPARAVQLGEACDIDALDLRLQEAPPPLQYQLEQGQWRRLPAPSLNKPVTLAVTGGPRPAALPLGQTAPAVPTLPQRLSLLSPTSGRDPARLRLRTRCAASCDPKLHPLVVTSGRFGLTEWRGPHAADIVLDLPATAAEPAPGDELQPLIGVETAVQLTQLSLSSCGLRESGQSLGELSTQLAVYPAEQHLQAWRREAGTPMTWPEAQATPTAPISRLRLERDGTALDATRWQVGLEDLDRQLIEGLGRLATAWERESGVTQARLQAEPRVLSGSAGVTWGWAAGAEGLATAPIFRLAGALDVVACQLNLRLSGALKLRGSLSRISLHCAGAHALKVQFERTPAMPDIVVLLAGAATKFQLPLVLELEALAQDDLAIVDIAGPVTGSLVGSCGLRARASGSGLQWFAKLAIEPVKVVLQLHDPLLGTQTRLQPLLPALTLLDWSLG